MGEYVVDFGRGSSGGRQFCQFLNGFQQVVRFPAVHTF